ncbi:MAG: DUF3667 domain-containing protein [Rhodothermales bacterium]|nr:DUF3667 domain-containing protein [Rhodothermales bacterium]
MHPPEIISPHPAARSAGDGAPDRPDVCANCGSDLVEAYCAHCGQAQAPFKRPLHYLAHEVVVDYFGFEGKLWRTLGTLVARPGVLTREYLDGRRVRYVRPVRLYLTASITLFFLLSVLPEGGFLGSGVQIQDASAPADSLAAARAAAADSLGPNAAALAAAEAELAELEAERAVLAAERDSLRAVLASGAAAAAQEEAGADTAESEFWERFGETMGQKGERLGEMGEEGAKRWFVESFTSNMPKAMFVLLPLFALLLKLLYVRRKRYYGEHLVFALHTHAYAFFAFAALGLFLALTGEIDALTGWPRVAAGGGVLLLILSVPAYVLLALKRVYGQGWIKTTLKWAALMSAYNVALILGMTAVVVVAFMLL